MLSMSGGDHASAQNSLFSCPAEGRRKNQLGIEEAAEKFVVGAENRTSVAKAGYGGVIYGTAEAVPFLKDRVLTQTLKPGMAVLFTARLLARVHFGKLRHD